MSLNDTFTQLVIVSYLVIICVPDEYTYVREFIDPTLRYTLWIYANLGNKTLLPRVILFYCYELAVLRKI